MPLYISLIILSYLSGSIITAVIACKISGLTDLRLVGSSNPGATNMARLYGKRIALLTLIGDIVKAVIPVYIAIILSVPNLIVALVGFAAFIGHLFPCFFNFRGGKGVATLIGVLFATNWMLGLSFIATWLIVALLFRFASLAAIIAALATPIYTIILLPDPIYFYSNSIMCALLILRHWRNIVALANGTEGKIS